MIKTNYCKVTNWLIETFSQIMNRTIELFRLILPLQLKRYNVTLLECYLLMTMNTQYVIRFAIAI